MSDYPLRYARERRYTSGPLAGRRRDHYKTWVGVVDGELLDGKMVPAEVDDGDFLLDCEDAGGWRIARARWEEQDLKGNGRNWRVAVEENGPGKGWHLVYARRRRSAGPLPKRYYLGPDIPRGASGWIIGDPAWGVGMWHPIHGYHPDWRDR